MDLRTVICLLAVIPMRKEPAHRSEMVSQMLFGEFAEVLEEEQDFIHIKCKNDGYTGWVQKNQLKAVMTIINSNRYVGSWTGTVSVNSETLHLPFSTPVLDQPVSLQSATISLAYEDDSSTWDTATITKNKATLANAYNMFLGTPYLWGGKSVYGIDCSGFVQQVFKLFGVELLRDAYLQAEQGEAVANINDASHGDLAFFHNEKGRITHVGLILSDNKIIHASGKVRIDTIDKEGILNLENNHRSHHLHSIRRFPGLLK